MTEDLWAETPPTEPGAYWLYGDASYGSMGGHYSGTIQPEFRLHFVNVRAISNGLMAITEGRFISLRKFDSAVRQEGHIGVWQPAKLPVLPLINAINAMDDNQTQEVLVQRPSEGTTETWICGVPSGVSHPEYPVPLSRTPKVGDKLIIQAGGNARLHVVQSVDAAARTFIATRPSVKDAPTTSNPPKL